MFSGSSQLLNTAEHCFVVWTVNLRSAVVRSWEEPPNILINGSEKRIRRPSSEFWSPHVIERHSKQEDIIIWRWPALPNLRPGTTRHMKNCISSIWHHEICRIKDVSLSLPSAWEPFWWQKVSYRKSFVTLWETEVYLFEACKESVSKRKNHYVASKSNLINLQFNLLPWSLQEYLKSLPAKNLC